MHTQGNEGPTKGNGSPIAVLKTTYPHASDSDVNKEIKDPRPSSAIRESGHEYEQESCRAVGKIHGLHAYHAVVPQVSRNTGYEQKYPQKSTEAGENKACENPYSGISQQGQKSLI